MTTIITERGVSTVITEVESGKTIVSQPPGPSTVISRSAQPGLQGSQGAQGDEGSQGTIGASGSQGAPGPQGAQGPQGQTGSQGGAGIAGPQGTTGPQGSVGSQGSQGAASTAAGPQGAQGPAGAQGSQGAASTVPGPQGAQGGAGSQGAASTVPGPQGSQGSNGAQGSSGAQGASGSQGSQGNQGTVGSQGNQGNQGASGAAGSQGTQGAQGNVGAQGNQGATGAQGAVGSQGVAGSNGAQGATGSQGNQGTAGAQGTQGNQGNQGDQGTPGYPTNFTTKTANCTAASNDYVLCNAAGGVFTVTLPSNPAVGTRVAAKKIDSSSNLPLVVPSGAGTIDGDASATLASQWAGAVFEHEGSDVWAVVAVSVSYQTSALALPDSAYGPYTAGTGVVAETVSRKQINSAALTMTSGTLRGILVELAAGQVVTSLSWLAGSTALASATHQWFCVLDANGKVLAVTADDTSTAWSASSFKALALTSPLTVPTTGAYYFGKCVVATTPPSGVGFSVSVAVATAPFVSASWTGQTTPPSVGTTLAGSTAAFSCDYGYAS